MVNREVRQSPTVEPQFFYGYIVVVATFFIMVVMWGAYYAFGVFFKPVLTEFGWTRAMTSGAFSLSMVAQGLLGIVLGGLNDRLGPRLVMTLCGFLLGLGYLLMSQIGAVWQLYLFYGAIIGVGMSGAWVPLVSTVARWFVKRRSLMTGIVAAGIGVGTLVASPVANWLISTYGWRTSYIIVGSTVLVLLVLAAQLLRRDPAKVGQVPYGKNEEEHGLSLDAKEFSFQEVVHTKQFWLVCSLLLCWGFALFATMVHIVPHATDLGISAASAANILATIGGMSIVGKVVLGGIADRIGNRQVFGIGFILMSVAFFWLVPATEMWMLFLFAVVFGLAYGGCAISPSPMQAALFGLRSHGLITGFTNLSFSIGAAVGPLLVGYIFDVRGSYHVAFLLCAAISLTGLIFTAVLRPIRGTQVKI
jgi:MFS family permease